SAAAKTTQPSNLDVVSLVRRPGDGDSTNARGDRRVRGAEWADLIAAPEPLAQPLKAALSAGRGGIADLAERDDRLFGVGQRPDVGREAVLEVVGLLHERHGLDAIGVADRQSQVALLYLQLALPQHVELDGRDPERAYLLQRGAVGRRVCDDELHVAAPGRAVVAQQVVDVAPQEGDFRRQRGRSEQLD